MTPEEQELITQFQQYVEKRDSNSCWDWLGPKDKYGRGEFRSGSLVIKAHILSWLIFNDIIPESKKVARTCLSNSCVNPNHMRLVDDIKVSFYEPKPLPKDFRELKVGTHEWKEFWKTFPHKQEEMIRYRKEVSCQTST